MHYDGFMITYSENINFLDHLELEDNEHLPYIRETYTPDKSDHIFCLKVEAGFDKKIWRMIEIKGPQTLTDLDHIIREAFNYDMWDHLSGFWKIIQRGNTKRTREVEIGEDGTEN